METSFGLQTGVVDNIGMTIPPEIDQGRYCT